MTQTLTAHQKLKIICDKIGHTPPFEFTVEYDLMIYNCFTRYDNWTWKVYSVDEREIIFNKEFMDKLSFYMFNNNRKEKWYFVAEIMWENLKKNLDNPTEYLFNLLK